MKKVEDKIKKARRIARQIEQALSDGNWEYPHGYMKI